VVDGWLIVEVLAAFVRASEAKLSRNWRVGLRRKGYSFRLRRAILPTLPVGGAGRRSPVGGTAMERASQRHIGVVCVVSGR
jgi:hypothetical protein